MEVVEPVDPRLLAKAAGPGRVRGIALEILAELRQNPERARSTLTVGLRQARALHSRERRLVGDAIRAILRDEAVLDAALGVNDDEARWLGWLVDRGLPPELAVAQRAGLAVDRLGPGWRERAVDGLNAERAIARSGAFDAVIAKELHRSLGERALDFVAASAGRAAVQLRVNAAAATVDEVIASLAKDQVEVRRLRWATYGLELVGRANLQATAAFRRGWFEVQDEGSQLLAELVDPQDGLVVDLCAGAGGKTLALAAMASKTRIIAADVRRRALNECRQRATRAGARRVEIAELGPGGALPKVAEDWSAERVLVDAPCSGTGTLRRHPELRLRLNGPYLDELGQLQRSILSRAASVLAPGGRLIYGTCSVLRRENDDVVDDFLAGHAGFRRVDAGEVLGGERGEAVVDGGVLRVAPHSHATDGFFAAVMERLP